MDLILHFSFPPQAFIFVSFLLFLCMQAIRTALKKLEEDGSSIEDAKAVCEPEVLNQIFKWKVVGPFF